MVHSCLNDIIISFPVAYIYIGKCHKLRACSIDLFDHFPIFVLHCIEYNSQLHPELKAFVFFLF